MTTSTTPHRYPSTATRYAIAVVTFLLPTAIAQAAPSGEDLMRAMFQAERTVSYSATETVTRSGVATVVSHLQKSQGKKFIQYSAPAIMRGDVLVDDGRSLLRYHRAEKSAVKTQTANRQSPPDWNKMKARMAASVQGPYTLNGRRAWQVTITTREKKRVVRKVWLDERTKIRLKAQLFDESGKVNETTTLSNLKFVAIDAKVFRWTPPAGTKVTNAGTLYTQLRRALNQATWLRAPSRVPNGYAFESAVVNHDDAWLRYSNGTRRFSIFQQRISDTKATPMRRAAATGSTWFWQKNGSRFLIVGLTQSQAATVAATIP
jgi:outer membrane lipoprotein-sorting protein